MIITKAEIKATSQLATYDAVAGIITLTENPQLQQGESVLIADRIKVYVRENRSQAEGNVRVTFVKKDMPNAAPAASPTPKSETEANVAATPTPAVTPTPAPKQTAKSDQKTKSKATPSKKTAKKTTTKKK